MLVAVLDALDTGNLKVEQLHPAQLVSALAELLLNSMGGTSGASVHLPSFSAYQRISRFDS